MSHPQDYKCPRCGQVDMVQKVSALVEGGTVAGVYSNPTGVKVSGVTLSAKASQLAPPGEPIYKKPSGGCLAGIFYSVAILWAMFWGITGIAFGPESVGATGAVGSLNYLSNAIGLIVFLIVIAFLPPLFVSIFVYRKRKKVISAQQMAYRLEYQRWQHAIARWNELYYCARNDVVFLPNQAGKCVPASEMSRLLYQP